MCRSCRYRHRRAADRSHASAAWHVHRCRRLSSARDRAGTQRRCGGRAAGHPDPRRRSESRRHVSCARRAPCRASSGDPGRPARPRLQCAQGGRGQFAGLSGGRAARRARPSRHRSRDHGRPFMGRHAGAGFRARFSGSCRRAGHHRGADPSRLFGHQLAQHGARGSAGLAVCAHAGAAFWCCPDLARFAHGVPAANNSPEIHQALRGNAGAAAGNADGQLGRCRRSRIISGDASRALRHARRADHRAGRRCRSDRAALAPRRETCRRRAGRETGRATWLRPHAAPRRRRSGRSPRSRKSLLSLWPNSVTPRRRLSRRRKQRGSCWWRPAFPMERRQR